MREVQVVIKCDKCGGDDAEPQAELNSKGKPVEVDLDKQCRDEFMLLKRRAAQILAPLTELVDEKGVAPEKSTKVKPKVTATGAPKKVVGERVCLICPETRASDTGILNHMRDEHNLPRSMVEIFGHLCPLDGEEFPRLAQHIAQVHKEHTHMSQAFAWAKQNGDERGIVAAQIAALEKKAAAA